MRGLGHGGIAIKKCIPVQAQSTRGKSEKFQKDRWS
jgi:hypothetical protein